MTDDELDLSLSQADMELLRAALVEHGKRLAAIEAKIDQQVADMNMVSGIIRATHERMKRISELLK